MFRVAVWKAKLGAKTCPQEDSKLIRTSSRLALACLLHAWLRGLSKREVGEHASNFNKLDRVALCWLHANRDTIRAIEADKSGSYTYQCIVNV